MADNVDSCANNKTALISEEIFCYVSNYLHCSAQGTQLATVITPIGKWGATENSQKF